MGRHSLSVSCCGILTSLFGITEMNERIKQLLNQAGIYQPDRFDAIDGSNQMEKFAELIVKECADWIDRQDESRCPYGIDLLEHFGVEE